MSGIAALFHRDGRWVDDETIWAMLHAVPHHGPDGMSVRHFGSVALGNAKFSVTPEDEFDSQPFVSEMTGSAITADVRLDNRDELISLLAIENPLNVGDAELMLRAYDAWGIDAIPRFLGDFAFVIWDRRNAKLVCARDTSGRRKLFYRLDRRTFAASTEIQQLLQDTTIPICPNEERIRELLVPLNMSRNEKDFESTFYEGIVSVQAGHVLIVDSLDAHVHAYWKLGDVAELKYRTINEYVDHYRELFFDAVRVRLRSSRPIGVLLSGGLDSASIACVAQELYRIGRAVDNGFTSFSMVFAGLECDERDFIQDCQSKYGFPAHFIECSSLDPWFSAQQHGFLESPNAVAGDVTNALFSVVTEFGVRAVLSGDVADSCIVGSPLVFDSLIRKGHFLQAYGRFRSYHKASDEQLRTIMALFLVAPLVPLSLQRRLMSAYIRRRFSKDRSRLLPYWMTVGLCDDLATRHLAAQLREERGRKFSNPGRETEYRLLYPPEAPRPPAPWPVELWQPFADRRLHEFLLAVPPEVKFVPDPTADGFYAGSKQLVRKSLVGILPESVRTRKAKINFGSALSNALDSRWATYEEMFGSDRPPEVALRGYVEADKFWLRLQQLRAGFSGGDSMFVTQMLALEVWLRGLRRPRSEAIRVFNPSFDSTQFVTMHGNEVLRTA